MIGAPCEIRGSLRGKRQKKHLVARAVREDEAEARRLLELATEQGLARAQFLLGVMHAKGQGGPQNYAEARRLLGLAAEQGHATALFAK